MLHLGLDGVHHHSRFDTRAQYFNGVIHLLYPLEYIKLQVKAVVEHFSLPAKKPAPKAQTSLGSGFSRSYDFTSKF